MIFIACTLTSCPFVARIHTLDDEEADNLIGPRSEWYPDRYPCPTCGERCAISTKADPMSRFTDLTPQEAFIAFSGVGLPDEHECSAAAIQNMVREHGVKDVVTQHISGTSRCTLDRIILKNGWVLHVGASTHGASVYRVQKESNYAEG